MQVVVVAREYRMLFQVNLDIKVARWTAVDPVFTFAGEPDTIAFIDPGGNLDGERLVLLGASGTATSLAGVGDEAAGAVTLAHPFAVKGAVISATPAKITVSVIDEKSKVASALAFAIGLAPSAG